MLAVKTVDEAIGVPGVKEPIKTFGVSTVKVREAPTVVKLLHVEESVKLPLPSGSFAEAFHQYWVLADKAV